VDASEFAAVLERYPELQAGLPEHVDELFRIAERIVELESRPVLVPYLPPDASPGSAPTGAGAPRSGRAAAGVPSWRGTGNTSTRCGVCAKVSLRYEDGLP
jgi:hypothetical protein